MTGSQQDFVRALPPDQDECIIWPFGTDEHGRPRARLDGEAKLVVRYLCEQRHGLRSAKEFTPRLSCRTPKCVNPRHVQWEPRRTARGTCTVDGCDTGVRSARSPYCEMHYGQLRRNGYLGPLKRADLIETTAGYVMLKAPHHPLTTPAQTFRVYEHRAEFYAHFGEGPFACAGCGLELRWDAANVCRHSDDKTDNRIGNLELKCRSCASKMSYDAARQTLEQTHYVWLEWGGRRQTASEWADELGLKRSTILRRFHAGWPVEKIVTTKLNGSRGDARPQKRKLTDVQRCEIAALAGHFSRTEIAAAYGVGATTISRIAAATE